MLLLYFGCRSRGEGSGRGEPGLRAAGRARLAQELRANTGIHRGSKRSDGRA